MGRRKQGDEPDWELIQREYRTGQLTIRQIAKATGVQPSTISRRAAAEGWVQDKRDEVRARSEAMLLSKEKATPTQQDIEIAATVRTQRILDHRNGLAELALATHEARKKIATAIRKATDSKEIALLMGALEANGRTHRIVIDKEREAFNIGPVKAEETPPAAPTSGDPREHYQWLAGQGRA